MSVSVGVIFAYIGARSGCLALVAVLLSWVGLVWVGSRWSGVGVRAVSALVALLGVSHCGGGPRAYRFAALRKLRPDGLRPFWCWVSGLRVVAFVG